MPYFLFLFISLVWGSSFILMHRATQALGPVTIASYRLLGGATVLGICWLFSRQKVKLSRTDWKHIFIVGLFANVWPFVMLPYTMAQADEHAYFSMMVVLVPLATILISIPMLNLWPSRRQLVGVLGGIACMTLVVQDGSMRGISPRVIALALTVPITYAFGNTYIKWKLSHLPTLPLTTLYLGMGGCLLLPLQFSPQTLTDWGIGTPDPQGNWQVAMISVTILSVICTGFAIFLFTHLIKTQGPLFAGMVTYVIPVLGLLWGLFDGEKLTSMQVFAIGGVLSMVALVQWGAAKPKRELAEVAGE